MQQSLTRHTVHSISPFNTMNRTLPQFLIYATGTLLLATLRVMPALLALAAFFGILGLIEYATTLLCS